MIDLIYVVMNQFDEFVDYNFFVMDFVLCDVFVWVGVDWVVLQFDVYVVWFGSVDIV